MRIEEGDWKMAAFLEILEISKSYGTSEVLRGVSLEVEKGEMLALIGPTGSGKTTLLKIIDLLEEPSHGRIIFDGRDVTGQREKERLKLRRRMSMVFQKPVMFKGRVENNVSYGLRLRGVSREEVEKRTNDVLTAVGLQGYGSRDAATLSGGEMQRIALARAMVIQPDLLLLDESTANLDPRTAASIEDLISGLRDHNTTIIMATHNMLQARRADRVAVLLEGRLAAVGCPDEIFSSSLLSQFSVPW
jgi:tungstate transport system ATP-binding protein